MESFIVSALLTSLGLILLFNILAPRSKHLKSLRDKHVLITGGSSGIGFSLAKVCLSEGAFVTLLSRNNGKLVAAQEILTKKLGFREDHIGLKAVDVRHADAVSLAIKESFSWKPIDMLICNAGITIAGELDAVDAADLETVTSINLLGCAFPLHAAIPLMKSRSLQNPSSIVLMGSASSLGFTAGVNMYSATKFALKGLAEYLKIELMPYDIAVSLVCPGFTETPMLEEADKVCETSDLLRKLCFYSRERAESPDDVATKTIEGAKRGELLVTTSLLGFMLGILGRGCLPAESLGRALLELVLIFPARLWSSFNFLYMKRVLRKQLQEKQSKQGIKVEEEIPYVHSIDDSAAGDDANLDMWSH